MLSFYGLSDAKILFFIVHILGVFLKWVGKSLFMELKLFLFTE